MKIISNAIPKFSVYWGKSIQGENELLKWIELEKKENPHRFENKKSNSLQFVTLRINVIKDCYIIINGDSGNPIELKAFCDNIVDLGDTRFVINKIVFDEDIEYVAKYSYI